MSDDTTITHEPVDDVPVIIAWLLAMRLDVLVDSILPHPHGNWKGLTYGQITVIWLAYILSQADHRLCPVEEWVGKRLQVLRSCTGWPVTAFLPEQQPGEEPAYRGFAMELGTLGRDPTTQASVGWMEQVFVVCNTHTAQREVQALHQRLERTEAALGRMAQRPGSDLQALQQRVTALLEKEKVADYLQVTIHDQVTRTKRLVGRGRRGPNRPTQVVEQHQLTLTVTRQATAIEQAEKMAGWRLYVTNAPPEQMSVEQSVAYYREQWQPERGFHRWKKGGLPVLPVYLHYEQRIRGLMVLLGVGLRVPTLVEFVVRRELEESQEKISGLYEGNRTRATARPTAERLFRAFTGIVLYRSQTGNQVSYRLTPLTPLQRRILNLMSLPSDLYTRLVPTAEFADSG